MAGKDPTDHDALHPGVWLAFADVSGQDSWRNLAAIKHERFTDPPTVRDGRLTFATESRMLTTNGQPLCTLLSRITLAARPAGYLLIWDATFVATIRTSPLATRRKWAWAWRGDTHHREERRPHHHQHGRKDCQGHVGQVLRLVRLLRRHR